jgi:hypothetical protein
MTIWATRSWSESVASVLSTQRRWAALSGSLGERGPVGAEAAGLAEGVAEVMAPQPDAVTTNAMMMQLERGIMPEYTVRFSFCRRQATTPAKEDANLCLAITQKSVVIRRQGVVRNPHSLGRAAQQISERKSSQANVSQQVERNSMGRSGLYSIRHAVCKASLTISASVGSKLFRRTRSRALTESE